MKPRLAILISGKGTNMASIVDNCRSGLLNAEVAFVASDKPDAEGLLFAVQKKIATHILPNPERDWEGAEKHLEGLLEEYSAGWVVLAGFMRILSPRFVAPRMGRIVNIHSSLLPSFPGRDSIRAAYEKGVKVTGVTVHLVDEEVDHGEILAQEPVRIHPGDTLEMLEDRIHRVEHVLYTRTLIDLLSSRR